MGMFSYCRLRVAPDLPAETLMPNCYNSMFEGCEYLDYIKIYYKGNFDTTSETSSIYNWVKGVQNSAYWSQHFYYRGTDWTTGPSAIPGGQWDIISNW